MKTTFKYAIITPEGKILNLYSNSDMFAKRITAENNLNKWIKEAQFHENNSRNYGLSYPEYAEISISHAESYKQQADMLETCEVKKIKITMEIID